MTTNKTHDEEASFPLSTNPLPPQRTNSLEGVPGLAKKDLPFPIYSLAMIIVACDLAVETQLHQPTPVSRKPASHSCVHLSAKPPTSRERRSNIRLAPKSTRQPAVGGKAAAPPTVHTCKPILAQLDFMPSWQPTRPMLYKGTIKTKRQILQTPPQKFCIRQAKRANPTGQQGPIIQLLDEEVDLPEAPHIEISINGRRVLILVDSATMGNFVRTPLALRAALRKGPWATQGIPGRQTSHDLQLETLSRCHQSANPQGRINQSSRRRHERRRRMGEDDAVPSPSTHLITLHQQQDTDLQRLLPEVTPAIRVAGRYCLVLKWPHRGKVENLGTHEPAGGHLQHTNVLQKLGQNEQRRLAVCAQLQNMLQGLGLPRTIAYHQATMKGNCYLLVVRDQFSRWVEVFSLPSQETHHIIRKFETKIFPCWGYLQAILTDNGTRNMDNTPIPPTSQPHRAENQELKKSLCLSVGDNHKHWDKHIPKILFTLRRCTNETINTSPSQLLLGQTLRRLGNILSIAGTSKRVKRVETVSKYPQEPSHIPNSLEHLGPQEQVQALRRLERPVSSANEPALITSTTRVYGTPQPSILGILEQTEQVTRIRTSSLEDPNLSANSSAIQFLRAPADQHSRFRGQTGYTLVQISATSTGHASPKHMARERAKLSKANEAMEFTYSKYWDMATAMGAFGSKAPCMLHASNVQKRLLADTPIPKAPVQPHHRAARMRWTTHPDQWKRTFQSGDDQVIDGTSFSSKSVISRKGGSVLWDHVWSTYAAHSYSGSHDWSSIPRQHPPTFKSGIFCPKTSSIVWCWVCLIICKHFSEPKVVIPQPSIDLPLTEWHVCVSNPPSQYCAYVEFRMLMIRGLHCDGLYPTRLRIEGTEFQCTMLDGYTGMFHHLLISKLASDITATKKLSYNHSPLPRTTSTNDRRVETRQSINSGPEFGL
ncbi:hypothetical protein PR048_021280 [Dryococelus australis]|uniref:Integrase catalytic domain-containing protein n=1 Tax=Dryococelus australis TaxID=614101 RepID=A0ABQ9GXW0_9NEOP|nr:hypothetical protein PR048_021280 [Dryococelus australis]